MAYLKTIITDDNKPVNIHRVSVYEFSLTTDTYNEVIGVVSDNMIRDWKLSKEGTFMSEHAKLTVHTMLEHATLLRRYAIVAEIEEKKLSEYYLKFGKI